MLETSIDVLIFLCIISAMLLISAVIVKSATIGAFSGVMFLLAGAYGLANDTAPLTAPVKFAVVITLMLFGIALIYEAYISWIGGGE